MAQPSTSEAQSSNMVSLSPAHTSPPVDLRRVTSNSTLLTPSHREHRLSSHTSQHLQTGSAKLPGSRSPSSIPSSPTSAHSSSSAIFERDIEPMGPPSPPTHSHPQNPHRIPRSKGTEQLEQSVPSVLDSAASILAASSPMEEDHIAVVTPARDRGFRSTSGFASPIGSLRSRSPSPTSRSPTGHRTSLLLSIPGGSSPPSASASASVTVPAPTVPPQVSSSSSPKEPQARLTIQTSPVVISPVGSSTKKAGKSSPSIINTPTSAYYSTTSSVESSPATTTVEHPAQALSSSPPPSQVPPQSQSQSQPPAQPQPQPQWQTQAPLAISPSSTYTSSPYTHPLTLSHPPSPTHAPSVSKRLSFISYSDLLASTPSSTVPLSSFTTCASSNEPPPHIPGVSGLSQAGGSSGSIFNGRERERGRERDSGVLLMMDEGGGEWEREGLGRGLEERLEALMTVHGKA
ncbi:hypothetical protein F5I97DRAFT_1923163 [Phlebopus sp. FC_14]|nr:hypothetical protein F5I97DRAFT_1923163 [Phlebopus sp. FC_14]